MRYISRDRNVKGGGKRESASKNCKREAIIVKQPRQILPVVDSFKKEFNALLAILLQKISTSAEYCYT